MLLLFIGYENFHLIFQLCNGQIRSAIFNGIKKLPSGYMPTSQPLNSKPNSDLIFYFPSPLIFQELLLTSLWFLHVKSGGFEYQHVSL